ncbi:MAG: glutamate-cysteine ligase family protein [Egibacteraceae bacterium]
MQSPQERGLTGLGDPPNPLTGLVDARDVVAQVCFPHRPDAPVLGRVGVETEVFAISVDADQRPVGRLGIDAVRAVLDGVDVAPGRLTIEPGAQVEHATAVHETAADAVRALESAASVLARAYDEHGVVLAAAGLDVWHPAASVPQQLRDPRYPAMAAYFARRGPHGHVMMCHTCSLQVNLDLGPPSVAAERWLVANLAAPLVTATFACSPVDGAVCGRALEWLALDPTRTGLPRLLVAGIGDPVTQVVDLALRADVLLLRTPDGGAVPGVPGWTFGDWLRDGHPDHGRPTAGDLAYHLTTLFPEVRARGFLEFRGIDVLPTRWRPVPVTLLAGLLYDDRARAAVRTILERYRRRLPALARRAAWVGVADPELCALAVETWSLALAGARRLHSGYVRPVDLVRTEAFLDRFTLRGRCPSDELREQLVVGQSAALTWASEPVEQLSPR